MSKHVIDGPKSAASGQAAERFAHIEGDKLPRPQTLNMQKRPRTTSEGSRLQKFTTIEKRKES